MRKRYFALLVVIALLVQIGTACSGKSSNNSTTAPANTGNAVTTTAPATDTGTAATEASVATPEPPAPVTYPSTLSVFCIDYGMVNMGFQNFGDLPDYQEVAKRTGTTVTWNQMQYNDGMAYFPVMIAGGDYPDLIMWTWSTDSNGLQYYVDNNILVDMTQYVNTTDMPGLVEAMDMYPNCIPQMKTTDGRFIDIKRIVGDPQLLVIRGPQLRQDWMDKLGLNTPTTLDELYNVLVAMKQGDPAGTGASDFYPLTASGWGDSSQGLMNFCYPYGMNWQWYQVDGQVMYGQVQPAFKEVLTYLNKLYSEGLLDPNYNTNQRTQTDTNFRDGKAGVMYAIQPTTMINAMASVDPTFDLRGIPHFKGPDGKAYVVYPQSATYIDNWLSWGVTTNCKDPQLAAHWLDYFYTQDGITLTNYGIEGQTYDVDSNGNKILRVQDLIIGVGVTQKGWALGDATMYYGDAAKFSYIPGVQLYDANKQTDNEVANEAKDMWAQADTSHILPSGIIQGNLTTDEGNRFNEIFTAIGADQILTDAGTDTEGFINAIIMGTQPLSAWDNFVNDLKRLGIDEATSLMQASYDRYLAAAAQ